MQPKMRTAIILSSLAFSTFRLCATTRLEAANGVIRIDVDSGSPTASEVVSIKEKDHWIPVLSSAASATRVIASGTPDVVHACSIDKVSRIPAGLSLHGDCAVGEFEERILLTSEPDVLSVEMRFVPRDGVKLRSVEDRYDLFREDARPTRSPPGPSILCGARTSRTRQMTLFRTGHLNLRP